MKKTLIAIAAGLALTACKADVKTDTHDEKAHAEHAHGEKAKVKKAHGEKGEGKKGQKRDLSGAAATLGVSEADLRQAMRDSGRPPNLAAAAASLGVSEADLKAALWTCRQRRF